MRYDPNRRRKYKWTHKTIELSIITVNYNGFSDTCRMIESIRKYIKSVVYEIIVVDNASKKDEALLLSRKYPFIHALRSMFNLGFAGGNNLGISVAKGKYLFFLNNDTFVTEDGFRHLINTLESSSDIAAVSPLIRYADEEERPIQFAGFTPLTRYTLRNEGIGCGKPVSEEYLTPCSTPYLHGAAMMVKREVLIRCGVMPRAYFLYYEELDWSIAMTSKGYTLRYDPQCTVFHRESRSTGKQSPLQAFYMTRNRFLFAYRNRTPKEYRRCVLYLLFAVFPRDCLRHLAHRRFKQAFSTIRGVYAYFRLTKKEKFDRNDFRYTYTLY